MSSPKIDENTARHWNFLILHGIVGKAARVWPGRRFVFMCLVLTLIWGRCPQAPGISYEIGAFKAKV